MIYMFATEDREEAKQLMAAPNLICVLESIRSELRKIWKYQECPEEIKDPHEAWQDGVNKCYDTFNETLKEWGIDL